MSDSDWLDALWLSVRIASAATIVATLIAVPLAWAMTRRPFAGRSLLESLLLLPIVLPPTVVGYAVLVTLGSRHGYSIVFKLEGAILVAAVVALPLLYLPAKSGFASVDREIELCAVLDGASRWQTFWRISLPLAIRGLASGVVLGFARALGEFGATVMVFGYQPRRLTLPISIYASFEQGNLAAARPAVLALAGVSFGLVLLYNASRAGRRAD